MELLLRAFITEGTPKDNKKKRFIDDKDANSYIQQPMRKLWKV